MKIAVSGASGLVGSALVPLLRESGHDVIRLVRTSRQRSSDEVQWDPAGGVLKTSDLAGVDAFVNLSGENLGQRWSEERKREFRHSRLASTSLIAETVAKLDPRPSLFISTSAVGYYGHTHGEEELDEASPPGDDFLAVLCQEWESAALRASDSGVRVVLARFGVILSPEGGMLEKIMLPFKLGTGGKVGGGDQWVSWIARSDLVRAIGFLIGATDISGAVNVTGPNPVTNETLAKELGHVLRRPAVTPVPAPFIRLALGREMADATVLASQKVIPRRLLEARFAFRFPHLEQALRHELGIPAR